VLLAAALLIGGCGRPAGHMVQGPCLSFNAKDNSCVVQDEQRGQQVRFSLTDAEIGPQPVPGDVLRVYYVKPGQAHRVMNVTRTDLFKK
jgi:hypothetical protein